MQCFYCGNEIAETENTCPYCGESLHVYRTILFTANAYYNDGLERARVRDLSGAMNSLKECLRYNKYHIDARNLLGLVYFEMGDMVQALSEWVISKNFKPEDNLVDAYLNEIQNTPGLLDKMSTTIKKYNQAIEYCKSGDRDLARIQLRRVLGMNNKMVKGHQLLALLCMQDGEYEEAKKALLAANKIDSRNTTTLRYMQEVKNAIKDQNANNKKRRKNDDIVAFQDGNDSIMMPKASIGDIVDNTKSSLLNIIIGAGIGILIMLFLVVPTMRQSANQSAANELISANEEIATTTGSIEALNAEVEALHDKLSAYEDHDGIVDSYDHVINAYNSFNSYDYEAAYKEIETVNPDLLGDTGLFMYNIINGARIAEEAKGYYDDGYEAYWKKDYDEAIKQFDKAFALDAGYDNGALCYYLAESHIGKWEFDEALEYYYKYIEMYPDGYFSKKCKTQIEALGGTIEETEEN